jgi:hypothetical protein
MAIAYVCSSSGKLLPAVRWVVACICLFLTTIAQAPAQQPFMTIEGNKERTAWWLVADFHPFTTEVRGISVKQIRKSWCKATEFRKDLIPKQFLSPDGSDVMDESGLSFAVEGHFDGSGTTRVALVGVYQECSGQKGRFILVLDQPIGGEPKIRFVDATPTDRQFGALQKNKDDDLVAWGCMECDDASTLKWNRKSRRFHWLARRSAD